MKYSDAHKLAMKSAKLAYAMTLRKLAETPTKPGKDEADQELSGKENLSAKEKKELKDSEDKGLEGGGKINKAPKGKLSAAEQEFLKIYAEINETLNFGDNKSSTDLASEHEKEMEEITSGKKGLGPSNVAPTNRPDFKSEKLNDAPIVPKIPKSTMPVAPVAPVAPVDPGHTSPFSDEHLATASRKESKVLKLARHFSSKL